jgi:rubrerythrin
MGCVKNIYIQQEDKIMDIIKKAIEIETKGEEIYRILPKNPLT